MHNDVHYFDEIGYMKICNECVNCGVCYSVCPFHAIEEGGREWIDINGEKRQPLSDDHYYIIPEKCKCCGECARNCPISNIR